MAKQREFHIKHDHGAFFADSVAIIHNPVKFIIDFKQGSPRIDQIGENTQETILIEHNVIMVDPVTAKIFSNLLSENIKNYEKQFGKIEIPKQSKKTKKKKDTNKYSYIG